MEIIQYQLNEILDLPNQYLTLYKDINFAIFDIETTGLNPKQDHVILIGLLYIENNNLIIQQFFCHNRKEEKELLFSFKEKIKNFDLLINYNGNSFDIPFLNKRFINAKINYKIKPYKSFDLLKLIKKVQHTLKIKDCKLKSVENYLDIYRNDTISGYESVQLYNKFEKNQNESLKKIILLHNYDDLYYLGQSLKILDQVPYEQIIDTFPYILQLNKKNIYYINKTSIRKNTLYIEGFCEKNYPNSIFYEKSFNFEYNSGTFYIQVPLYAGKLSSGNKCLYIDLNDFSYCYDKQLDTSFIENILIFKENNFMNKVEIYSFIQHLIQYILKKIQ